MVAASLSPGESMAELVLGLVGFVTAVLLISSPIPTFHTIRKTHEVGGTNPYSYLAVMFNSGMWVVFGIPAIKQFAQSHHHEIADYLGMPLMAANCYGIVAELCYVAIFIRYAVGQRLWPAVGLGLVVIVTIGVLLLLELMHWSRTFVGYLAMFSGVAMYAIPVYTTYAAYKANAVDQISTFQGWASLANGLIWTVIGSIGHIRAFIFAPNLTGVICAGGQLIARVCLKRKIARQAEANRRAGLAEAQRIAEEEKQAQAARVRAAQDPELGAGNGGGGAGQGGNGADAAAVRPEAVSRRDIQMTPQVAAVGGDGDAQGMGGAGPHQEEILPADDNDDKNQVQQGDGDDKDDRAGGRGGAMEKAGEDEDSEEREKEISG